MPQKHDNCTRKVLYGIGEGVGGWGGGKSDYKDCFRSQKSNCKIILNSTINNLQFNIRNGIFLTPFTRFTLILDVWTNADRKVNIKK